MSRQANEGMKDKNEEKVNKNVKGTKATEETDTAPKENASESHQDENEKEETKETKSDEKTEETVQDPKQLQKKIAEQATQIKELKKTSDDLKKRWMRAQADFDNYRKRSVKEKAEARKYRAQDLVTDMLETLDNFKRALEVETVSDDGAALKKGMEMVLGKLEKALKKEGVEEIDSLGKPFDPNVHQAVMQEASDEHDSGIVTQVLQAGYTLNGRVIRPAMVKVSA
jgi:molecular chaperone GrpE